MFQRMIKLLKPAMCGLLLAGCAVRTEPAVDTGAAAAEQANMRKVTLYVEGMIQRQGIT